MTPKEIAQLQAKNEELESEMSELRAKVQEAADKNETDAVSAAELKAKEAEFKLNEATLETEELKKKQSDIESEIKTRNLSDAQAAVADAVKRGVIAAKDEETQKAWTADITENPFRASLLSKMAGSPQLFNRSTNRSSSIAVTGEDPRAIYKKLGAITARQSKAGLTAEKSELSKEFASLFCSEFGGSNGSRLLDFPLTAIVAGDVTDANLATLSGSLVAQRTLQLLKFTFPVLTRIVTDFSDQPAQFNQTIITRTVTVPAVSDYNTTTGWTDSTAATADVPVTIDQHKGVPITFNQNILASTARRLFDEFAPAAAYALGKVLVDALYARITDANFTNNTVSTDANFTRTTVVSMGTQLTLRGNPYGAGMRTLLLYPTVFQNLVVDSTLVTFAAYQKPEIITGPLKEGSMELVIPVDTFGVISAPNLPANNGNVSGFGFTKSALIMATRLPNDYTTFLPG